MQILAALLFFYLLTVLMILLPILKVFMEFFDFIKSKEIVIYIEQGGERWYLYHPTSNDYLYFGNKKIIEESTEFRFFKRDELMKHIIKIDKENDNK